MRSLRHLFVRPVVLSHHGVGDVDDTVDPNRLIVSPKHLTNQILWLKRLGYRFATANEVIGDDPPPPRIAVLTFDDGWRDAVTTAAPLLDEHGIKATFYVCPALWGTHHPDVRGAAGRLLTRAETRALHDAGMELGSHSLTHRDLRTLSSDTLKEELEASKAIIEDVTGEPCRTFAFPYGLFREREIEAVGAAGYELAFAWRPGRWSRFAAPRLPAPPRHGGLRLVLKLMGLRRRIVLP